MSKKNNKASIYFLFVLILSFLWGFAIGEQNYIDFAKWYIDEKINDDYKVQVCEDNSFSINYHVINLENNSSNVSGDTSYG